MSQTGSAPETASSTDRALDSAGSLDRRHLLRGGAVLAGAAGAVALSAVTAPPAHAADGGPVIQGQINDATSTTTLRIGAAVGADAAALSLRNADGPSLELQPLPREWDGPLSVGQIANTEIGPSIGILDPEGFETVSYLATEFDLNSVPRPVALTPTRFLDTRNTAGRANIINTPAANFDADGRLKAGKTLTVAVADSDADTNWTAVFLNVISTGSLANGYLTLYPPGPTPAASTINFTKGQTLANGAFVAVGNVAGQFAFSVYGNALTHVIVDISGVTLSYEPGPDAVARKKAPGVRRTRAARRTPKLLARRR